MKPLAIDLFHGLGGWAEGLISEGFRVIGVDIKDMYRETGTPRNPDVMLLIQDVLTLHGSQFRDAAVIVASPPCQNYSYLAMPWSRSPDFVRPSGDGWEVLNSAAAKEMREEWEREGPDNRLFDACFRIQREAIEAAGRFIPLIVENVRGANEWVSPKSRYNYGSFHLWGDVPAIMPIQRKAGGKRNPDGTEHPKGSWFAIADSSQGDRREGQKTQGCSWLRERNGVPQPGIRHEDRGEKKSTAGAGATYGGGFGWDGSALRTGNSKSSARKAASAQIAKIPLPLSEHIARVFRPVQHG